LACSLVTNVGDGKSISILSSVGYMYKLGNGL
jgi:hypothetical protein